MFKVKDVLMAFVLIFVLLLSVHLTVFAEKPLENIAETENLAAQLGKEWNGESINRSIMLFEQSADYWNAKNQPNKATDNLREVAKLKLLLSQPQAALDVLQKAHLIDTRNNYLSGKIENLSRQTLINLDLGNLKESEKTLAEANKLLETTDNKNNHLSVLYASGYFFLIKYQYQKSIESFEKALALASELNSIQMQGEINHKLSYVFMIISDYSTAKNKAEAALNAWRQLNDNRGIALTYTALGRIEWHTNSKQKAFEYFRQAENLFPENLAFYDKANLDNGLAAIYEDYQRNDLSYEYRKRALESFRKAKHNNGQIQTLLSISKTSLLLNDWQSSIKYLDEAKRITKDKFFLAIIESERANYYFSLGDYAAAESLYQTALQNLDKEIYKYDAGLISLKLGEISLLKKDYAGARKHFANSAEFHTKSNDNISLSEVIYQTAKLDLLESKTDDALQKITESIRLTEKIYSDVANSSLQRSYFANVYSRYEFYISLLMQKHKEQPDQRFDIRALQANEKLRSRSLLETLRLSEAKFVRDANPELIDKENNLRKSVSLKADKLTGLLSRKAPAEELKKAEDELRSLEHQLEEVKAELKQSSPIYSGVKNPPPFEVSEFQQNILDEKTVLLEFALGDKESYLWLIGKNEVSTFVLPARARIENRVDKILQTFENRFLKTDEEIDVYQKRIADLEEIYNQEAKLLSQELLGQFAGKIKNKRLLVVPDGKLHYLPLTSLPAPDSDELLISNHEIIYEPSASSLNLLARISASAKVPKKDLLVFADPVFSAQDSRLVSGITTQVSLPQVLGLNVRDFRLIDAKGNIPRLFASRDEANSIIGTLGKSRTTAAIGYEANRERVLSPDISDYRILHFATHGLIDAQRPEVSGIVLSQFDESGNNREGFLRLQDIYAMNLAADLVVLSACQSGIGKEIKGEGLMSLNNAFLQAGSKAVLSSAWKVDDSATAELMKVFYANLFEKQLTPSEALRQAQISLSKTNQFKSPFYWAAFTVQGEFRQPISFSPNYFNYLIFALAVVIICAVFWRLRVGKLY